ncbi:serine/threonine-protein kinase [Nonomuraea sp. NPDC049152]|uniref:serine/threonine protein kinase n=1 Tax=Nonomuraea sp. NPDC049152 TaxID=3154350 RepID=UPI003404804C
MHPLRPGDPEQIGEYSIQGRLGEGPRGVVYLGQESEDQPTRVVKLLAEEGPEVVDTMRAAKRVSSSYVARVLDTGLADGVPYLVREHVEGRSLAETVQAEGPLDGDALERVAVGMLTALTAIHLTGQAHRGLTPTNVILGPDGPRVTDAGIGEPVGEIGYRAPEQLNGLQHGPYADIFSWAATVVFAATGVPPFGHDMEAVLNAKPDVGPLPQPLRKVVVSALAKDVGQRPTTYTALLQLLGDKSADKLVAGSTLQLPPVEGAVMAHDGPPIEGVPVQQVPQGPMPDRLPDWGPPPPAWSPPGIPTQQGTRQQEPHHVLSAQVTPQGRPQGVRRKSFPLGLAAGVGVIALLSGAGLWGASQYTTVSGITPATAEGKAIEKQQQSQAVGGDVGMGPSDDTPGQGQPTAVVTVPWATPSTAQDDGGVGPLVLPSEYTSDSPQVPVLTSVPVPTQSLAVPTVQPQVTQPSPTVTVTATATPKHSEKQTEKESAKPSEEPTPTPTPKPKPTEEQTPTPKPTPSEEPTPTPKPTPSEEPTPTPTPKPKPTEEQTPTPKPTEPSPKPTPTKTSAKPTPSPTKSTPPPPPPSPTKSPTPPPVEKNPHTASQVCGPGFYVQRQSSFTGGTTYQMYNSSTGTNCVVTMKTTDIGKATPVSATLEVQGGGSQTDSGNFEFYAGPVKLPAKGKCVKYSGSTSSGSTGSDWGNCS